MNYILTTTYRSTTRGPQPVTAAGQRGTDSSCSENSYLSESLAETPRLSERYKFSYYSFEEVISYFRAWQWLEVMVYLIIPHYDCMIQFTYPQLSILHVLRLASLTAVHKLTVQCCAI